ncbi:MAG: hypothetical protein ACOX9R_04435 [Armatimonadota bacterium]
MPRSLSCRLIERRLPPEQHPGDRVLERLTELFAQRGAPDCIRATFSAPDRPSGFTLGGTPTRATRYDDLDAYSLTDDGRWHTVEIDVRQMREAYPELQHLRQFIFYTNWREAEGQKFWFDNFFIQPE